MINNVSKAIVENVIKDLEHKIIDCEINKNLNLTVEDFYTEKKGKEKDDGF